MEGFRRSGRSRFCMWSRRGRWSCTAGGGAWPAPPGNVTSASPLGRG
jgi:hypothetical protein